MSIASDYIISLFRHDSQQPDRAETIASATTAIGDQLLRCIVWLLHNGVAVSEFRGWNAGGADQLRVTCVGSPKLHALFSGECECLIRADLGNGPRRTWVAQKFGVRVEWEEASC